LEDLLDACAVDLGEVEELEYCAYCDLGGLLGIKEGEFAGEEAEWGMGYSSYSLVNSAPVYFLMPSLKKSSDIPDYNLILNQDRTISFIFHYPAKHHRPL
jgi:hypothetical protein